ncbi:sensor histidine kinase [Modicisalibacter tunisiensis]|uniref:histidine kinase n=1 Tax=Modicisalibacter tunisiensis TaxID=390637 RepID=A0ABS7WY76_9GAMM|nr:ATP-binding protein [Modicisalibacter tunisiensis]MBZ9567590.1 sensor histidine kinase N-terminal domain-containing protein [Modicisalibacter tunisiensis]
MKAQSLSLHMRLLVWLLILLGLLWLVIWTSARHTVGDAASREVDQRLQTAASLILNLQIDNARPSSLQLILRDLLTLHLSAPTPRPPGFELVSDEVGLIARSADFPQLAHIASPGFSDLAVDDQDWRVFTMSDQGHGLTIRVAVTQAANDAEAQILDDDFTRPLLWLLPAFVVLAFVSVWRGLAPLRRIESAIAEIDPTNPRPLGLDASRVPDELRQLLATLDRLLIRVRDVLMRQRVFTVGASHELRTPIAGCRTQLQVARRSLDSERCKHALEQAQHSLDHLARLVEALLLLARLDPCASQLKRHRLDLVELTRSTLDTFDAQGHPGVACRLETSQETIFIEANPTLLETLILNLLKNAYQASPPDGTIRVRVSLAGLQARLSVIDEGPGIPEASRERVFDPFHKGDGHATSGHGLGLAIVRTIARVHGGDACLRPAPGGGTEAVASIAVGTTSVA